MSRFLFRVACTLVLAAWAMSFSVSTASAHGHAKAGEYEIEIGFHNEPAYVGEPNGLDLFIANEDTGQKIDNLSDKLKAEIIFGSSKREVKIKPQWEVSGAYTADVLPTQVGDYTWHIWGDINGTPVDITMASGPDTFGSVQAKSDVSFPVAEPTSSEISAQAAAAAQSAQLALIIGSLGLVLGLVGLGLGLRKRA